jgi:hypothetical protein
MNTTMKKKTLRTRELKAEAFRDTSKRDTRERMREPMELSRSIETINRGHE